jgi:hypothetical protein
LREAAELKPPHIKALTRDRLNLSIPPHGLALVELK